MPKKIFTFFILILVALAFGVRIKVPAFDKENSVLAIYSYDHADRIEITVVFWDEDHPKAFTDFIYDLYRFFKWGRFYDVETFFIFSDRVEFEDDFCDSQSYFQTENLHNKAQISIESFERENGQIVIYVSTWNHMFSNRPLQNTKYISFDLSNLEGTRQDVEKIYSWRSGSRLKATFLLSLSVVIFALLTIVFKMKHRKAVILKTLTTSCAVAIALLNANGIEWLVFFGLLFGLLGDVFLEKSESFLHGMIAFLIGHLFYSFAFVLRFSFPAFRFILIVYAFLLFLYFVVLHKHLGKMRLPIFVYVLVIGWMFCTTFSVLNKEIYFLRVLLPLAGGLFVFSDFCIAVDKYIRRLPTRDVIVLASYFLSQWIISISTIL
ncbi:MAG: lysoplasmalogenase [Pseudothermotoga sp.]